jgi:hypothetical protein
VFGPTIGLKSQTREEGNGVGDSSESEPRAGAAQNQEVAGAGDGGDTLADAARDEREVAAGRLREELGRDPGDEEIDEWLRRHTEGY